MSLTARPRVVTANVATLDGRIAASRSVPAWRDERWAPVAAFETVDVAALHGAAIRLEGSNSFVAREAGPADLPLPADAHRLDEDFLPARVMDRSERWMAVVDGRGRVAWTETEGGDEHLLVLVCRRTPPAYLAFLREREVPYLLAGEERVDLGGALRRLGETFRAEVIMSTAGGLLTGALLRAGLVDEVDLQIVPFVLGLGDAPVLFEGYGLGSGDPPLRLTLLGQETRADGSLFLRFTTDREWT